jgi:hypothetical protein
MVRRGLVRRSGDWQIGRRFTAHGAPLLLADDDEAIIIAICLFFRSLSPVVPAQAGTHTP